VPNDYLEVFSALLKVAREQNVDFLVVGASARDILFHYLYKRPVSRIKS
jgi:predicted nucleotidyltransferase